jgi:protein-S-isoprenylcysteine O-methyltransferase Ste14
MPAPRDAGRVVAVPLLTGLLVLNGARLLSTDAAPLVRLATAVAVCFYLVLAVQYLRRGAASHSDSRPAVWLVAVGATVSPFAIPLVGGVPAAGGRLVVGTVLVLLGTGGAVWAATALGRSISVIPQARTLASHGPYRWLRHPLYVFEIVASAGVCLVVGGALPWLVLAALFTMQVARARWEERLLLRSVDGYAEYRGRTIGLMPTART